MKVMLRPLLNPLALAVNCLPLPAVSIRKLLNVAIPLPAPVPRSRLVVPCNGPVPLVKLSATVRLDGKPLLESLPNASWLLTTGCVPKDEPAVALLGCVAKTSVLAAAGLDFVDVVKTTIFMIDLAEFEIVNRIYGEHFEPPYPARSTVQVAALPRKARIEIDAIALKRD